MTATSSFKEFKHSRWACSLSIILTLAGFLFLLPRLVASSSLQASDGLSDADLQKIDSMTTVDEFQSNCGNMLGDPRKLASCQRKLVLFRTSYLWIDRDFLISNGATLTPKDLDLLYGFSAEGSESSRLAVLGVIASWCREKGHPPAQSFDELESADCLLSLPTLAEAGFEIDRHGSGIRVISSTYDATKKTTWVSYGEGLAWRPRTKEPHQ